MKKLLVLMLVLGVASVATATLSLVADGSDTLILNSNTTPAVDIYIVVDASLGSDMVYTETAGGNLSSHVDYGPAFDPGLLGIVGLPVSYVDLATIADSVGLVAGDWATVQVSGVSFDPAGTLAVAWVVDTGTTQVVATGYVIPEPMTMGLLAVGGLFLRRRK